MSYRRGIGRVLGGVTNHIKALSPTLHANLNYCARGEPGYMRLCKMHNNILTIEVSDLVHALI